MALRRFQKTRENLKNLPLTYAGRLDPMAEGLLLILAGEECKKKDEYLRLSKQYEFEILMGFQTDTYDILGLLSGSQELEESQALSLQKTLQRKRGEYLGEREEVYPLYSSKPVRGKPLFMYAREGKDHEIEIPKHRIEIEALSFGEMRTLSGIELLSEIKNKVLQVSGDFRQQEIIKTWEKHILPERLYYILQGSLRGSGGFYVRSFVERVGKDIGVPFVTYSIKRTQIGSWTLEEAR